MPFSMIAIVLILLLIAEICFYIDTFIYCRRKWDFLHVCSLLLSLSHIAVSLTHICFADRFESSRCHVILRISLYTCFANCICLALISLKSRHIPLKADVFLTAGDMPLLNISDWDNGSTRVCETENLYCLFPKYDSISFSACRSKFELSPENTFCAAAAFQKRYFRANPEKDIIGSYISNGHYVSNENTTGTIRLGAFVWDGSNFGFFQAENAASALERAAVFPKSCAFSQIPLIIDGKPQCYRSFSKEKHCFRVLAEHHGTLCIIDGKHRTTFNDFYTEIQKIGLSNAIYLDMGTWMNASWYRKGDNSIKYCFPRVLTHSANSIVFINGK